MTHSKIPVLITAVGGMGEQILRSLQIANEQHDRYHLIVGDMSPHCPQFEMADEAYCLPSASDPRFIEALQTICRKHGVRALFYGCEPDLHQISLHRKLFEDQGILVPLNPEEVIRFCMDKAATVKVLTELGFAPPRAVEAENYEGLSSIDWFPIIIKPSQGSGGSAHCYIAQNAEELRHLYSYLNIALPGQKFIVQEYVGDENSEYTVGILHDMDGNYLNSIAMRRILKSQLNVRARYKNNTGRKELGSQLVISSGVSHGHMAKFPEVTERCKQVAKAIGARGAINIQLRLIGDEIKIFEINPRFSGTTSLRAMMGYNEPDVLIRKHLLGEKIAVDFAFKEGTVLRSLKATELSEQAAPSWESLIS